jgi:hypothetical protein
MIYNIGYYRYVFNIFFFLFVLFMCTCSTTLLYC